MSSNQWTLIATVVSAIAAVLGVAWGIYARTADSSSGVRVSLSIGIAPMVPGLTLYLLISALLVRARRNASQVLRFPPIGCAVELLANRLLAVGDIGRFTARRIVLEALCPPGAPRTDRPRLPIMARDGRSRDR
jgi:hypothetical protein